DSGVVVESFEVGDNCVSYFQTNKSMSEEEATTFCSGGEFDGLTLQELLTKGYINLEELKTNNVIKNVVISSGEITITDYNINIGGIDVVIPSTIDGKTVVAIGSSAFMAKSLSNETSMLNKNNIQFMSNKEDREIAAVHRGNIKSVVIPSTVKSIGKGAFANNQISSVTLSNGLKMIEGYAFNGNQLTSIIIPDSVTSISEYAFADNQITSVIIENAETQIGCDAFSNNSDLTSIKIAGIDTLIDEIPYVGC
ncbi:MAG: leucine-rich repeat domain-containing protein, partial [Firmicutes bacterium]|nr:leucine-rich repeat domain-containing protein [Bacillota bacterium]